MSSWIVLYRDYAKLKLSDGTLDHLREEMFKIAQQWDVSNESQVVKFIGNFYGSVYKDVVDYLIEKNEIELFGKLFLAAIEKSDAEEYFDYFEQPDDLELEPLYYKTLFKCFEPVECCDNCLVKVNKEEFIKETGGIFKWVSSSTRYYDFANKILEYAAKLEY